MWSSSLSQGQEQLPRQLVSTRYGCLSTSARACRKLLLRDAALLATSRDCLSACVMPKSKRSANSCDACTQCDGAGASNQIEVACVRLQLSYCRSGERDLIARRVRNHSSVDSICR